VSAILVSLIRSSKFRFYTLHEALEQASALKRGVYGDLRAVASSTAEAPGGLRREAGGDDEDAEEALECIYCMDDPAVEICAFCGCVVSVCVLCWSL
jgi:hypothetical protein